MTLSPDYVLTHWGENWCWSLFRLNGVEILGGNVMPSLSWCQSADNLWVKTNRITYLVETAEPLFSFSYVFLLIICIFLFWNLCGRIYPVANIMRLLSIYFFWSCLFLSPFSFLRNVNCNTLGSLWMFILTIFLNSSVRFVSGSSLCLIPSPNKTSLSHKVYFQSKGWIGCTMPLLW